MFLDAAPSAQTVATGESYLKFIGYFFCIIGFKMAVDGILRGAGDVKAFTIANLVNLGAARRFSWIGAPLWGHLRSGTPCRSAGWPISAFPTHTTAPESGKRKRS